MVRQLTQTRPRGWKGLLAAFIAAGAVAWQIMACVESPMSFSPEGDLAFTVMDPYPRDWINRDAHIELAGGHVYRLMVLSEDREIREIERSSSHMLSAPAFSPDGQRIAYLRRPLVSRGDVARIDEFGEEREDHWEAITEGQASDWVLVAPEGYAPGISEDDLVDWLESWDDMGLQPLDYYTAITRAVVAGAGLAPSELVIRQASSGEILHTVQLILPGAPGMFAYLFTGPQFSPDGQWIYFALDNFVVAVNPATDEKRIWGVSILVSLSPDGRTLAMAVGDALAFVSTDGERATHVRPHHEISIDSFVWAGNETLLVLRTDEPVIDFYSTDGHLQRSVALTGIELDRLSDEDMGELALSPDGEYMAVSSLEGTYFLTGDGALLGSWSAGGDSEQALIQPVFTHDSRQVAFKLFTEEGTGDQYWKGTTAIVFFTPEGREVSRIPIPRISPDERPAPVPEETQQ